MVADEGTSLDLGELLELHGTRLKYEEMKKLAELFTHWAATEDVNIDQRGRLRAQARAFGGLADFCGPDWVPRDRDNERPDLLRFIAEEASNR